jgi:hypothetical protein
MEDHMIGRIGANVSAAVLIVAALVSIYGNGVTFAAGDDEGRATLVTLMSDAKVSLQQGLAASEQQGKPISAKFEVEDGKLQLSVYTVKDRQYFETIIDHMAATIAKVEPITEGEDLAAAKAQDTAMANAKISLKAAVDKLMAQSANVRAVGAVPSMKDGHPVISISVLNYNQIKTTQEPLD